AHFDMSLGSDGRSITESVSSSAYTVQSQLPAFNVKSPDGVALRFDGYSNFVKASLPVSSFSTSALTIRVVLAAETYPMMNTAEAENTPTYATICGNLNESAKQGFAFQMSSQGDLRFQFGSAYADGYLFTIDGSEKLKCGQWNVLTVVLDKAGNKGTLYLNGNAIGTCRMSRSDVQHSASDFWIGKDATELKAGPFLINTFCGLMDDIAVYNSALTADEVAALANNTLASSVAPDFNYPWSRYAESLWRPQFHGMPSGGWTNECHGMTYSDGRYHVFFQKNANGPYMARLHWGHISSENLYSWTEEPIAIAPGESYDIKGCWSGCVFTDAQLTGGKPNIIYTAVDNAKAVMAQASPADETLADWNKQGVIINGRPSGLSDDFRDPYFFAANGQKYIIVGTSKNGVGACTLHQYQNGSWTNDGSIFFQGTNANQHGTFWEMPNMTDMGNGKWLFTCTPLNTGAGVRTLCWVGSVGSDGKFVPDNAAPQFLEMNGISKDGYGLLSPTIYQKDGKTLLLGIVPDKLAGSVNAEMGWAHNYSLPREISLASDGSLVQKPYSGLTGMRTETKVERTLQLNGTESLAPVSGRQVELLGEFTVGGGEMGFRFLKKGDKGASLTYNSDNGMLTLDLTALDRTANDNGVYNGVYAVALPKKVAVGQVLKLHVFLDGSIADIFVNDTWAYSVRLFPTNAEQTEAEVFATSNTTAKVSAWLLDAQQKQSDAIGSIWNDSRLRKNPSIYNLQGMQLSSVPTKGMCIINGKKYYAR
ncbi:MAG: GH32 C-terminal domain-containing protein, partial [Bacteroidaceae bacterium]|nr:GH32 C-terminal domain-containing protein [Bacteroidaceae bacterium]